MDPPKTREMKKNKNCAKKRRIKTVPDEEDSALASKKIQNLKGHTQRVVKKSYAVGRQKIKNRNCLFGLNRKSTGIQAERTSSEQHAKRRLGDRCRGRSRGKARGSTAASSERNNNKIGRHCVGNEHHKVLGHQLKMKQATFFEK